MVADVSRAPEVVREQIIAPAIQAGKPTINSVTGALNDTECLIERLRVLLGSATAELHEVSAELPLGGGAIAGASVRRLYDNWLVFEIVGEKLAELEAIVSAINEKAHSERRAVLA